MLNIVAIDPGKKGGFAVCAFGKTYCHPMPESKGDVVELIRNFKTAASLDGAEHVAVLEKVGGYVGKGQPGSAMFTFGEGFGFLQGCIQSLAVPLVLVTPQVWQKSYGLGTASACATSREWKNKLKDEAQRRYPEIKVTHQIADALLILNWARAAQATMRTANTSDGAQVCATPAFADRPTKTIFRWDAEKDSRDGCATNNKQP